MYVGFKMLYHLFQWISLLLLLQVSVISSSVQWALTRFLKSTSVFSSPDRRVLYFHSIFSLWKGKNGRFLACLSLFCAISHSRMVILSSHSMCGGKPDSTEAAGGSGRQGLIKEVWLCLWLWDSSQPCYAQEPGFWQGSCVYPKLCI